MKAEDPDLPSDRIQEALRALCQHFDQEDESVRERMIREYRRNKFYWDGFTNIFWSQTNHDYRMMDSYIDGDKYDTSYYDKRINIYQAYLESIIAAMSASIPGIKAYPDDAENPNDITTAKACDKIYELLKKVINGDLKWLTILFILVTEGMVAAKICKKTDKKYGTTKQPIYQDYEDESFICPSCNASITTLPEPTFNDPNMMQDQGMEQMPPDMMQDPMMQEQMGEMQDPSMMDQGMDPSMMGGMQDPSMMGQDMQDPGTSAASPQIYCPECDAPIDPEIEKTKVLLRRISHYEESPKSQIDIEVFGGLYVKIPIYARNQEEMPYLRYTYETHYSNVRKEYPHIRDKFSEGYSSAGFGEPYEKWGRLSTQYLGDYPTNTLTCSHYWFRPETYYTLRDDNLTKELEEMFPDGCCVTLIEDQFAGVTGAKLDDEWVITKNPLSDYVTFQPMGTKMIDVQDISNELLSLTLQTIEHGIPQTFADPNVLDFTAYGQTSVSPGMLYPAVPKGGKSMGDAFYEVKTATLSAEVLPFGQSVQSLGQLAVGALPSLFGGADMSGSKTASQYSMSRNQAMQRLQNSWKMLTVFWKDIFTLAIPAYMECVTEDEKFVKKDPNGSFINVFIRKVELEGKIGSIELEGAENLPSTWMQKKDTIMQFLQAANPVVMQAMIDPINLPIIAESVGLGSLSLPGVDDRTKQYEEIGVLISSAPIMMPAPDPMQMIEQGMDPTMMDPSMLMPQEMPSVEPEPEVDMHQVHIQICKSWLVGDAGRLAKIENPDGYRNVLLHFKMHKEMEQQEMMQQAMMGMPPPGPGAEGPEGPPQNDTAAAPVKTGNANG